MKLLSCGLVDFANESATKLIESRMLSRTTKHVTDDDVHNILRFT